MKKLISLLIVFMLAFCGAAFADSEDSLAPYQEAADFISTLHFLAIYNAYGEENCEPYLMTKPNYSPELLRIDYGTNNDVFRIVMFCDDAGTGITQIHLLFNKDVELYDAYIQAYGLMYIYKASLTEEEKYEVDPQILTMLTDAIGQPDSVSLWESEILTLGGIVDIAAYKNNATYALRFDFRQPITVEYLNSELDIILAE